MHKNSFDKILFLVKISKLYGNGFTVLGFYIKYNSKQLLAAAIDYCIYKNVNFCLELQINLTNGHFRARGFSAQDLDEYSTASPDFVTN